jgi:uncharacterized OB-fold protein
VGLANALNSIGSDSRPRFDAQNRTLQGSKCRNCESVSWPARPVCQDCGDGLLDPASFGPDGQLTMYAEVWVPVAGMDSPYILGRIQMEAGPTVFAHVRGIGGKALVPLAVVLTFADSETAIPPFWFEAV